MPSTRPLPTIDELIAAFHSNIRATRDKRADKHDGSVYDYIAGASAILWSQEAQRDRDIFRARYDATAAGEDLTNRFSKRYDVDRYLDDYGVGNVTLVRATTTGGAGRFWKGDRLRVTSSAGRVGSTAYAVAEDTDVSATAKIAVVPIRATTTGTGTAIDTASLPVSVIVDDVLWDSSWTVARLICADGTDFEKAADFRARTRQARLDRRLGYETQIIDACRDAGAASVALFRSDFGGEDVDHGINAAYVGDAGFTGSPELVRRIVVALERFRVAGADLIVRPLATAQLTIAAVVSLWDDPSQFNTVDLTLLARSALMRHFSGLTSGFAFQRDALAGVIGGVSSAIQSVTFTTPSADVGILVGGNFPATLTRYQLSPSNVTFSFQGPQ